MITERQSAKHLWGCLYACICVTMLVFMWVGVFFSCIYLCEQTELYVCVWVGIYVHNQVFACALVCVCDCVWKYVCLWHKTWTKRCLTEPVDILAQPWLTTISHYINHSAPSICLSFFLFLSFLIPPLLSSFSFLLSFHFHRLWFHPPHFFSFHPHSLLPLFLTDFLSFYPSLSHSLSLCSGASWHGARECWYQLVDWGLPTWRREKKREERDRQARKREWEGGC